MYNYSNYYPQAQMRPQAPITSQYGLKGRPVSSLEEARAISIDFDGSVFYFPDLANRRIYTKQINMDGTASLNMYELKEVPTPSNPIVTNYVTREEFEEALSKMQEMLKSKPEPEETKAIVSTKMQQTPADTYLF